MKIAVSILWLAFALLFVALGRTHWIEAGRSMPPFELTRHGYEVSSSGFQLKIDVSGTPLDQPFQNFTADFNAYLDEQNRTLSASNRRAAWGYFLAAAAAIGSWLLGLRGTSVSRSAKTDGPIC